MKAKRKKLDERLGQLAYESYCEARGWKSFNGDRLPPWGEKLKSLRNAWCEAAEAVKNQVLVDAFMARFKTGV